MAENKKSFVLYADLLKSIEHLTNEEKGVLFNHLLEYVNDKNPILSDRLILTAWKPIELQLKRDLIKFEEVKAKRSDAGKRSAELRALKADEQISTNPTSVESDEQSSTNPTVNDTVNVNVNDTVNVNDIKENNKSALPFKFFDSLLSLGADKQLASDWIAVRKLKKLSNTLTAFNAFKNELDKSGKGINEVLNQCVINSWGGFKYDWIKNKVIETIPVSGEKMIKYISNVNPTPSFLEESKFLAMQERNLAGGYIYTILP